MEIEKEVIPTQRENKQMVDGKENNEEKAPCCTEAPKEKAPCCTEPHKK